MDLIKLNIIITLWYHFTINNVIALHKNNILVIENKYLSHLQYQNVIIVAGGFKSAFHNTYLYNEFFNYRNAIFKLTLDGLH